MYVFLWSISREGLLICKKVYILHAGCGLTDYSNMVSKQKWINKRKLFIEHDNKCLCIQLLIYIYYNDDNNL